MVTAPPSTATRHRRSGLSPLSTRITVAPGCGPRRGARARAFARPSSRRPRGPAERGVATCAPPRRETSRPRDRPGSAGGPREFAGGGGWRSGKGRPSPRRRRVKSNREEMLLAPGLASEPCQSGHEPPRRCPRRHPHLETGTEARRLRGEVRRQGCGSSTSPVLFRPSRAAPAPALDHGVRGPWLRAGGEGSFVAAGAAGGDRGDPLDPATG